MAATVHGAPGAVARRLAILENADENEAAQIRHHRTAGKTAHNWETLRKRSVATNQKRSGAKVGFCLFLKGVIFNLFLLLSYFVYAVVTSQWILA